ncbi:zinc-ribbon domain-containing protein [Lachnoclostridium edouardi]|uniref:zinc-ribbon domain-containing protein n=1 Tax=Lachnoclostridium edouardi TaxID=1926283 RepID=UPI000C798699|nr:zinc ribbon domain-containing protein [Lachnoclostridium edouardi]
MSEKKFCQECGAVLETNVAFCPECGKKVQEVMDKPDKKTGENSSNASGFLWTRFFNFMNYTVLVFAVLILLFSLYAFVEDKAMFLIGTIIFVLLLYAVSTSMVFGAMALNIEKMTNNLNCIEKLLKDAQPMQKE